MVDFEVHRPNAEKRRFGVGENTGALYALADRAEFRMGAIDAICIVGKGGIKAGDEVLLTASELLPPGTKIIIT